MGEVRHIVLLKVRGDAAGDDVEAALAAARSMAGDVPGLLEVVAGPDVSTESMTQGYTHALVMRFADTAARDGFLVHPAHAAAMPLLTPLVEGALVLDVAG
jgi:hypothetical protein